MNRTRWDRLDLTLTEFYHPPAVPEHNRDRNARSLRTFDYDSSSWAGMSKGETLALPARGWPAGVEAALRLLDQPELAAVGATRMARRWSDDDGETLDVARALDGLPCWRQAYRTPGAAGGRVLTLVVHAGGNCNVTAGQIAWKAYAAVRYVDAMESAGFRVAVDLSFAAEDAYDDGSGWACMVHVKQPDDPVDLSQIAAVLSAAAFRWYGFTWQACSPKTLRGNRGHDRDLWPDDLAAAVYMPADVKDRATAQRWLESTGKGRD